MSAAVSGPAADVPPREGAAGDLQAQRSGPAPRTSSAGGPVPRSRGDADGGSDPRGDGAAARRPLVDAAVGSHALADLLADDDADVEDIMRAFPDSVGLHSEGEDAADPPARRANSSAAYLKNAKGPKPFSAEVESGPKALPVLARLDTFLFDLQQYFDLADVPQSKSVMVMLSFLEGRAKDAYRRAYQQNGGHLSFAEATALLKTLGAGTDDGPHAILTKIHGFRLLDNAMASNPPKNLIGAIASFDKLVELVPSLDPVSKCYALVMAVPKDQGLYDKIRYDMTSGAARDWTDYERLKTHVTGFAEIFDALAKSAGSRRRTYAEVAAGNDSSSRPSAKRLKGRDHRRRGSGAATGSSGPSDQPRSHESKALQVPSEARSATHTKGARLWIKNMTPETSARLRKQGKCLLCQKSGHMVADCPNRERAFEKGTFFFY